MTNPNRIVAPVEVVTKQAKLTFSVTTGGGGTPYSNGSLIANSTIAGSIVFPNAALPSDWDSFVPVGFRITTNADATGVIGASETFRLRIFSSAPVSAVGDGASEQWTLAASKFLLSYDLNSDPGGLNATILDATGSTFVSRLDAVPGWFTPDQRGQTLYLALIALNPFNNATPAGKVFTVELDLLGRTE